MENAFHVMVRQIQGIPNQHAQETNVVMKIVMACVILHSILKNRVGQNIADDQWGNQLGAMPQGNNLNVGHGQRGSEAARLQRISETVLYGHRSRYIQVHMG